MKKKYGGAGLLSEKKEVLHAELNERRKQPLVDILQQPIFHNIFIVNFPSRIFFNDINHGHRAALLKKNS